MGDKGRETGKVPLVFCNVECEPHVSASIYTSPAKAREEGVHGEEEEGFDHRMVNCVSIVFNQKFETFNTCSLYFKQTPIRNIWRYPHTTALCVRHLCVSLTRCWLLDCRPSTLLPPSLSPSMGARSLQTTFPRLPSELASN